MGGDEALGRELGVTPQTSRRWLAMLGATFQWFEISAFAGNTVKRISGKPKGYISDTGLACNALALSAPSAAPGHPQWGALFETTVVLELRKQMRLMPVPPRVSHWRTHAGAEVDLVLERDGKIYLIEFKGTPHPKPRDASGLQSFRATYPKLPIAGSLVVCPCEEAYPLNENDVAMPWDARMSDATVVESAVQTPLPDPRIKDP